VSHRAEQIIQRIRTLLEAQVEYDGVHVYAHRRLSLAEDQDELPAISVDFGQDSPVEENIQFIDSLLTVAVTSIVAAAEEDTVKAELLELRRQIHIALMEDVTLGLPFVISTSYGGAEPPAFDLRGEFIVGALATPWNVYYRMLLADPGD
jgi:hypothetical protein